MKKFIREKFAEAEAVLLVCTGVFPVVRCGVLNGKRATATREFIPQLAQEFPDVKWDEKRWVRDGKIWTSGAVTNGIDMVAAFIRENYPHEVAEIVCAVADVGDRPQEYPTSASK